MYKDLHCLFILNLSRFIILFRYFSTLDLYEPLLLRRHLVFSSHSRTRSRSRSRNFISTFCNCSLLLPFFCFVFQIFLGFSVLSVYLFFWLPNFFSSRKVTETIFSPPPPSSSSSTTTKAKAKNIIENNIKTTNNKQKNIQSKIRKRKNFTIRIHQCSPFF